MSRVLFFILVGSASILQAQKQNSFYITLGFGPNYLFNDKSVNGKNGETMFLGLNYQFSDKKQNISVNPGLRLQMNNYHTELKNTNIVHIDQHLSCLTLDVLMRLTKKTRLRVGLFYAWVYYASAEISWKLGSGRGYMSNSDLVKGYSPTRGQAGFTLGPSFTFKMFKREHKFNIQLMHIASPLVNSNYKLSISQVGEDLTAVSVRSRPWMLLLGFDINLKKIKKQVLEEED